MKCNFLYNLLYFRKNNFSLFQKTKQKFVDSIKLIKNFDKVDFIVLTQYKEKIIRFYGGIKHFDVNINFLNYFK